MYTKETGAHRCLKVILHDFTCNIIHHFERDKQHGSICTRLRQTSADFGRLRKTSDFFGRLRNSSGIFGNDRVVFKNPSTPRIKISRLYLRKSWQVYEVQLPLYCSHFEISEFSQYQIILIEFSVC